MLLESFVAIMALIAACSLQPGVYFAVNSPAGIVGSTPAAAAATITQWGYPVTPTEMENLARDVGEKSLFYRTGGAPSLALGMAHIFGKFTAATSGGRAILAFWYHFAIMFEALFILTVIDAGTRVGRFMLQDLLGHMYKPLGRTAWMPGMLVTSAAIVLAWGYFLYQGVLDPLGGINSLWPLFGIANQLLAAIAFCVATTILVKMHGARYMWITCVPLAWLVTVTFSAGYEKIFSDQPRLGFLAEAAKVQAALDAGTIANMAAARTQIFNAHLNAFMCGIFLVLVTTILIDSVRVWAAVLTGAKAARVAESPFVLSRLQAEEL
jgi:carbon starvation protein